MMWFHWAPTGRLEGEVIHAGTRQAALERREALARIPWDADDLSPEVPLRWRESRHSRLLEMTLLVEPANHEPVRDDKVYDYPESDAVLYVNAVEDAGSVSCRAPVSAWAIASRRLPQDPGTL
jgi:hypothetical protein